MAPVLNTENSRNVFEQCLHMPEELQGAKEADLDENGNFEIHQRMENMERPSRKRHGMHAMQGELLPPLKKMKMTTSSEEKSSTPPKSTTPAPAPSNTSKPMPMNAPTAPTTTSTHVEQYNDPFYAQLPLRHPNLTFVQNPMSIYLPQHQQEQQMVATIFTKPNTSNLMHTFDATSLFSQSPAFTANSTLNVVSTPLDLKLNVEQDLLEKWNQNMHGNRI